ncbi:hypothetical protein FRC06_003659 [Ceratobasidium sp. 370]|nr:hypothetical protein FRC06_003659 [Ceratobasidium sp. 370]
MADKQYDILIIGATGYTGRLVVEYLSTQKAVLSLRVALGGRTLSAVQELANGHDNWEAIYVDVSEEDSVLSAVEKSRVVMSLAGPWWAHGSTVVRACARYGVHYVDITGEAHWVAKIIEEYDFLAHKTGACVSIDKNLGEAAIKLEAAEYQVYWSAPVEDFWVVWWIEGDDT